jgi:putative DNA primase/helicase
VSAAAPLNGKIERFKGSLVCPVCKGSEDDPRGNGSRCHGFYSEDRQWIHCSREEYANGMPVSGNSNTYAHRAKGPCRCGAEHAPADPAKLKVAWEVDKEYRYIDSDGKLRHETIRYKNPKKFRQRRPGPDGKPIWDLKGIETILYRLPELIAADPLQPVFVVEGEKDVDRLVAMGRVATCNPMGALKWTGRYSDVLRGRHVIIIGDNDDDGRQHAKEVAYSLQGKATSIKVVELPGVPEKGDVSDFFDLGGTLDQFDELVTWTVEWVELKEKPPRAKTVTAAPAAQGEDKRVLVEVNTRRDLVAAETIKAIAGDEHLYCRGETLGIVSHESNEAATLAGGVELQHAKGNLRFLVLSQSVLSCRLTQYANFFQWRKDRKGEDVAVECHPPDWLVAAVAEQRHWPGIRNLLTITECPYVLGDGSLAQPGFDPASGTLFQPSVKIAELPDRPNREEAKEAAKRLLKPFEQFPFEDEHSKAVFLADLLTSIQRPAIRGPVPGFAFNGNKAGTGKGLLIDSIGILVWGHDIATRAYTSDPVEAEKVKLSLALAAVPVIHFDNLPEGGFYGGSVIDSALTTRFAEGRILGQSRESGPIPLRPVWNLSGNNVSPMGDANRRWLPCNLVTSEENPHERSDITQKDLRQFLLEHRADLLHDALLILKAHARAGRPGGGSKDDPTKVWAPLGSFEEWDSIVRGAVWFATRNDCLTTQRKGTEEMPERSLKLALLDGWKEIDPTGAGCTVEDAVTLVNDQPTVYATLRSAFLSMSRDGKMLPASKIIYKLRAMKKTPLNHMRFEKIGENRNHQTLWSVITV